MKKLLSIVIGLVVFCCLAPISWAETVDDAEPGTSWLNASIDNVSVTEFSGCDDALIITGDFHKNAVLLASSQNGDQIKAHFYIQVKEDRFLRDEQMWQTKQIYLVCGPAITMDKDGKISSVVYGLNLEKFRYTLTMHFCPRPMRDFYAQDAQTKKFVLQSGPVSIWKSSGPVVYYKNYPKGLNSNVGFSEEEILGTLTCKNSVSFYFHDYKKRAGSISMLELKITGPGVDPKKVYRSYSTERTISISISDLAYNAQYSMELTLTDFVIIRQISKTVETLPLVK